MNQRTESSTSAMVVGGAGFIGSHLVDRLVSEGFHVEVVDDLSTGTLGNLASARSISPSGTLHIHTLDAALSQFADVVRLRRPEVLYLLSALTPSTRDAAGAVRSFGLAVSVLEAARAGRVGKVVVTIPADVLYGEVAARDLPLKEDRPRRPIGVPGVVAWSIVDLLGMYRQDHDIEFTVLALSTVYGPRQTDDNNTVSHFAAAQRNRTMPVVQGDVRQTRDFIFVDDVVDAAVRASSKGGGLLLHIGSGVQTSLGDLWASIGDGRDVHLEPRSRHDLTRFALSPARARLHLGWAPWTRLDDGLSQTLHSRERDR